MTRPSTVIDNSLLGASGEMEGLAWVLRWRPGLCAIHEAEEDIFYIGLHMKSKEFRSLDEIDEYIDRHANGQAVPRMPPETPFEKAQALVYETIGAPRKARVEKCRRALDTYTGCADAWLILSEYEKDPKARVKMLRQAVKAGEESLRDAGMEVDNAGHPHPPHRPNDADEITMWAREARPYMRARLALAEHLYEMGERDAAIDDYRDLLELNPEDNQGVRYLLVSALLEKGSDSTVLEAAVLVQKMRDVSPMWAWTKAFVELLDKHDAQGLPGPGPRVLETVARAYWANPIVPGVLLRRIPAPRKLPDSSAYGTEDEALIYGAMAGKYWKTAPDVLKLLADAVDRITAGLPSPFEARTSSGRARIEQLWRAHRYGEETSPGDSYLLKALVDHPEYAEVWFMARSPRAESLDIDGWNPFEHVGIQEAIERILDGRGMVGAATEVHDAMKVPDAMRNALQSLIHAGISRHGAIHFLAMVYEREWLSTKEDASLLDAEIVAGHLRYVARLASGEIGPDAVLVGPARNDPCPCGSGRKLKKCCGRRDSWPTPAVVTLARTIKSGQGKVPPHKAFALSPVMGQEM